MDAHVAGAKHLPQLVTHQIDDALEAELRRYALLDAVDHRQLGVPLLGFLQQALGLVEQARVLERDGHAGRERLEQADVVGTERVLALHVVEAQHAEDLAGDDQRHQQERLRRTRTEDRSGAAQAGGDAEDILVGEQRATGADDLGAEAAVGDRHRRGLDAHTLVNGVGEQEPAGRAVDDPDSLQRAREHFA